MVNLDELINRWQVAKDRVMEARSLLSEAEQKVSSIETEIAESILPEDAKSGEVFQVWFDSKILVVSRFRTMMDERWQYRVNWR